jgi:adenylate cyclase
MTNEQGHILVVDDQKLNRLKLSLALQKQGHTVALAKSGLQALEMLQAESFDLVLLDLLMPEMDGYQLLAQLKQNPRLRDLPVIVITSLNEMEGIAKAMELGAEDYLPKNFEPALFRARIGACLEKKRLHGL